MVTLVLFRSGGVASGLVHFVIMGCGRVGATLAHRLEDSGHSVAVIDQDPAAFRRLSDEFDGQRVTGLGFDRDALRQAGIDEAYGFAAVSSGDNSNIIAARVVRETFGVDNVVARIYDPRRAQVYQRLGIPTVATVPWTTGQILGHLMPAAGVVVHQDAAADVSVLPVHIVESWVGRTVADVERAVRGRVSYLVRRGRGVVAQDSTPVMEQDVVHVAVPTDLVPRTRRVLADAPVWEGD